MRSAGWRAWLYIRFDPDRLLVRDARTGIEDADAPDVALDAETRRVLAVGSEARHGRASGATLVNPFGNSELIRDFDVARVRLLRATLAVMAQRPRRIFVLRPYIVIHPLRANEGRAASERPLLERLGRAIGGRRVLVHYGPPLADGEVIEALERGNRGAR